MPKTGWWHQVSQNDYPETKKSYGDARAVNWRPESLGTMPQGEGRKAKVEDICPNCGRTYWVDKGCPRCGYPDAGEQDAEKQTESHGATARPKVEVRVLCPRCGARMVKRRARKGPNAGNEFWGCSRYPECRGTSPLPSA